MFERNDEARRPLTGLQTPKQDAGGRVIDPRGAPSDPGHTQIAVERGKLVSPIHLEYREIVVQLNIEQVGLDTTVHRTRHSNALMDRCLHVPRTKLEVIAGPSIFGTAVAIDQRHFRSIG